MNQPETESCRWCGYESPPPPVDLAHLSCCKCGAYPHPTLAFNLPEPGAGLQIWHNPDNSLFIEFKQNSGKTSRYTLSEALLLKAGVLTLSDQPLNGRKR